MGANCSASLILTCYVMANSGKIDKIRNRFSFIPPNPPSYSYPSQDGDLIEYTIPELKSHILYQHARRQSSMKKLITKRGKQILGVYVRPRGLPRLFGENRVCILHCHGNATDIGLMMPSYLDLAENTGVDVFAVEYTGFVPPTYKVKKEKGLFRSSGGESSHHQTNNTTNNQTNNTTSNQKNPCDPPVVPNFRDITADAEAAFEYLVHEEKILPNRIIFYGQSVGSAPLCELGSRLASKFQNSKTSKKGSSTVKENELCIPAGIIFHSAMLSGIRVLDPEINGVCRPSSVFRCFDIFKNYIHIRTPKEGKSPLVLLIHGRKDTVVPFIHSEILYTLIPEQRRCEPYFPSEAGHNDLVECNPGKFYFVINEFVNKIIPDMRIIDDSIRSEYSARRSLKSFKSSLNNNNIGGSNNMGNNMGAVVGSPSSARVVVSSSGTMPTMPETMPETTMPEIVPNPTNDENVPPMQVSNARTLTDNVLKSLPSSGLSPSISPSERERLEIDQMQKSSTRTAPTIGPIDGRYHEFRKEQRLF